jgi:hypothetical protein
LLMMPAHVALLKLWQKQLCSGWKSWFSWEEDNDRQCNNCTRVFPWFSIKQNAWLFEVSESIHMEVAQRTEGQRREWTKWACPCNISYDM